MRNTARRASANLPSPYPVEGGHVPIYSIATGRIQKRNWVFRNPAWCELCKEPVSLWVNHHGRKDHALMDCHYNMLVEFPRSWNPEDLLRAFSDTLEVPIETFYRKYGSYERNRRNEIYAMIRKLEAEKMLFLGEPRNTFLSKMQGGLRGMDHQGALVLHQFILGPLMRIYPDGHIQDFSNLVDFITCSYNMETVYDLCGFYTLDAVAEKKDIKPSSPAALGLGGIAASSTAQSGFVGDTAKRTNSGVANKVSESEEEEAFSRKATFIRSVLGQLRFLINDTKEHPEGKVFAQHLVVLGELLLKSLVVEIISVRICEYMVRVESVWREHGLERRKLNMAARLKSKLEPDLIKEFYRPMSPKSDDLAFFSGSDRK